MNKYHVLALSLLILGIIVLGYSTAIGESEVIWLVIIPIIIGHGIYSFIGVIIIILAIFTGMYAFIHAGGWVFADEELYDEYYPPRPRAKPGARSRAPLAGTQPPRPAPRPRVSGGGVILIGPIPIIFGSDNKTAMILSILAIIIMIIAVIAIFGGFFIPR